ncbi:hypothetical protein V6R86_08255 [Sphingomonas kaistensis]|uniref:Uncharacterized protein n=1 Tax=Sphingomonas kaistensis TaxID=298708 RepID=A0ABZ2G0P0_9SPHN
MTSKLFYGDNSNVLRTQIADAEIFQGKKPGFPFGDPASVRRAKRKDVKAQID